MKIYTILLFSIAALLAVLGILICCGKLKKLKNDAFGNSKFVGASLLLVSAILTVLGFVVIADTSATLFLLVTGSLFINGIFVILKKEQY